MADRYKKIMALPSEHLCILDSRTGGVNCFGPREHVEVHMEQVIDSINEGREMADALFVPYDGEWVELPFIRDVIVPTGKFCAILTSSSAVTSP